MNYTASPPLADVRRGVSGKSKPLPPAAASSRRADLPDLVERRARLERAEKLAAQLDQQARSAAPSSPVFKKQMSERADQAARDVAALRSDVISAESELRVHRQAQDVRQATEAAAMKRVSENRQAAEAAATERALGLARIHALAARHGVHFDLVGALNGTVTVRQMGAFVTDKMAEENESTQVSSRVTCATAQQANDFAGWAAALESVVAKQGGSNSGQPVE
jgi:hypothetical protein